MLCIAFYQTRGMKRKLRTQDSVFRIFVYFASSSHLLASPYLVGMKQLMLQYFWLLFEENGLRQQHKCESLNLEIPPCCNVYKWGGRCGDKVYLVALRCDQHGCWISSSRNAFIIAKCLTFQFCGSQFCLRWGLKVVHLARPVHVSLFDIILRNYRCPNWIEYIHAPILSIQAGQNMSSAIIGKLKLYLKLTWKLPKKNLLFAFSDTAIFFSCNGERIYQLHMVVLYPCKMSSLDWPHF